jgi:hypothetical protein
VPYQADEPNYIRALAFFLPGFRLFFFFNDKLALFSLETTNEILLMKFA